MTQISRTLLTYKSQSESPIIVYDIDGEPRGPATVVALGILYDLYNASIKSLF